MNKLVIIILLLLVIAAAIVFKLTPKATTKNQPVQKETTVPLNPLSIEKMRADSYPGSDFAIEQTLADGVNYKRYIVSYLSQGLKIYGLLTIPTTEKPKNGYPAIIFNHGYIPPTQYVTTERYVAYQDFFARAGYIVFKSDYRGNGNSEGLPEGAYYSPAYTIDVLNALSSVKKMKEVDVNKIGMWGHSMGGNITLRAMVIAKDIKVGVIWGGVVGTYNDIIHNWHSNDFRRPTSVEAGNHIKSIRENLMTKYGEPLTNPKFWDTIDPRSHLAEISAPIQLDVGESDEEVPPAFSEGLNDDLKKLGKTVEFYSYPGADHNISQGFNLAAERSLDFFDRYLKN